MSRPTRTRYPSRQILDVAAVVLGEARLPLTGWQRRHAMQAMTALGYPGGDIADALCIDRSIVSVAAHRLGVRLLHTTQRPDWVGVTMVVTGTARMRLRGIDRIEAIRQMAAKGVRVDVIAWRTRTDMATVRRLAYEHLGLDLPKPGPDATPLKVLVAA